MSKPVKKFTDEEISQLKQAFALFDLDCNGFITNDELGTVLRKMGQEPTDEEVAQMIAEIDEDGDGTIDFDEFCELMEKRMSDDSTEADIIEVFKVFVPDISEIPTLNVLTLLILFNFKLSFKQLYV